MKPCVPVCEARAGNDVLVEEQNDLAARQFGSAVARRHLAAVRHEFPAELPVQEREAAQVVDAPVVEAIDDHDDLADRGVGDERG